MDLNFLFARATVHDDRDRLAPRLVEFDQNFVEGRDIDAVYRDHAVARLKPEIGASIRADRTDDGFVDLLAGHEGDNGEDRNRQKEIGERPGEDRRRPLPQRGAVEGARAVFGREFGYQLLIRTRRGGVHVAEELHIAAKRQKADFPTGSVLVGPPPQLLPEADGKRLRLDAAPAPDNVVAVFVNEDDKAEDEQEGRHPTDIGDFGDIGHDAPDTGGGSGRDQPHFTFRQTARRPVGFKHILQVSRRGCQSQPR